MENTKIKTLRRIAHHLDSVVSVGDAGVTDGVVAETQRALDDHELIKVRLHTADRAERAKETEQLAQACDARVIQKIGKIAVLFKPNPDANPKLSNLHRFSGGG